ncbi:helix-turn-helix domain-containing protein [uncultured Sphingomonas sp.]|uniref:helix-turn-helix domain-containing protein n=1 Tax=uncultured Sphingomonas sp. TaxID=158754 RepID=UPI0035C9FB60
MKAETFDGLMSGMSDVLGFYKGERDGFRVREAPDIKAIRAKVGMTQPAFARAYKLEVATLRDWEQGRRQPDRSAQVLLALIDREPETIRRILG